MKIYLLLLCLLVTACDEKVNLTTSQDIAKDQSFTIAFGSCNKQYKEQPLWPVISKNNPKLWIWLGDVIYADTEDMQEMKEKYEQQLQNSTYKKFIEKTPVIGTWDDHDYGENNAGKEYTPKQKSQQLFLDFLGEHSNSKRRKQQGIYWAYNYKYLRLKVKIFVLDTRYHRDLPGKNTDILGAQQWKWLQKEFENSDADLNVICSSIQVISDKHRYEKWANFPKARKKLFSLIRSTKLQGALLLSGDRHFSEISENKDITTYPVYEITCSGMTHNASLPLSILRKENTKYRISDCFNKKNFGQLVVNEKMKSLSLQIRDHKNKVRLEKKLSFKDIGISYEE